MTSHASTTVTLIALLLLGCQRTAERGAAPAASDSAVAVVPPPADTTPAAPRDSTPAPAPKPTPSAPAPAAPTPSTPPPRPRPTAPKDSTPSAAPAPVAAADPWHPAPHDTLDNDTYQGWKQFELNCSRCHGEYGVGTSFAPALVVSLKDGGTVPTKEFFIQTVCAGRLDKGMPSWCALGLEMDKIQQIYLYLKGRADGRISAGRPALR